MFVIICIVIIGICTLTALAVAVLSHFGGYSSRSIHDGWFVTLVGGMVLLTIVIAILCNTTNWK